MNLTDAVALIRSGNHAVAREDWGHRVFLYMSGDIIMLSRNGYAEPWVIPHPDVFADDWREVQPHP